MKKLQTTILFFILISFFIVKNQIFAEYQNPHHALENILSNLQSAEKDFYDSQSLISDITEKIQPLKTQQATLENQLIIFSNQQKKITEKIHNLEKQINVKRIKIAKFTELIERANIEIEEEKELLLDLIKQIYLEERTNQSKNNIIFYLIESFTSKKSLSQELKNVEYIRLIEQIGRKIFLDLENAIQVLLQKQEEIEKKKKLFNGLKKLLNQEKDNLNLYISSRQDLLTKTQGQEKEYQKLLTESKKKYEKTILAISHLKTNKDNIQAKLNQLKNETSAELRLNQEKMLQEILKTTPTVEEYQIEGLLTDKIFASPLMWPISPSKGLTSYFLDPSYEEYFGVKHYAIDIRASQGTPVRAPASGYVQEVVDNGLDYSYIILVHKNNLSTLYGHLSTIFVKKDQIIQMGQVIGRSGGTPGTKGSGLMTTGPHLHFEVHEEGVNKNPLNYLPLELLDNKYY